MLITETNIREDDEKREYRYRMFLNSIQPVTNKNRKRNYSKDEVIFELEIKGKRNL